MIASDVCRNNSPTRQDRLRAWLALHRKTVRGVAEATGICRTVVHAIFQDKRAPQAHIDRLIQYGIPADLLPAPRAPLKPGPKPRVAPQAA
ncbi:MAG TPA: helix-turn-helix transcriptional regulator [Solidesulfovibrio magneticus]|nr:helix-turn-helix transcriptional regulator [Solidesulfovibrio magneticus]